MSSLKTELYLRQVLGRILRVNSFEVQHAWLFTFAEPNKPQISIQLNASNNPGSLLLAEECNGSSVTLGSNSARVYEDGLGVFDELQLGPFRKRVVSAFSSI